MKQIKQIVPGLLFTLIFAWVAISVQQFNVIQNMHLSSLIIAILAGMLINNLFKIPNFLNPGIRFSMKTILRIAIILLGFKLSLTEVTKMGGKTILLVVIVTFTTILFTLWQGNKLKLNRKLSLLIASGCSICGASAIAAVAPVIDAEEDETTFAIATITIFGTIVMFLYPIILNIFNLPNLLYAVWVGSSIHEVAQVVAAGFAGGNEVGQYATLVKLARVLLIIPTTILLVILNVNQNKESAKINKINIPLFVFGFLAIVILNSTGIVPSNVVQGFNSINNFLLTTAMMAMGLETSLNKMKKVGLKPMYLGLSATFFIASISYIMSSLLFT